MFSLESPHRGDSNEYTLYTIFNINTKNYPKLFQICSYRIFFKVLRNEFETAVVNESSVFEPLKFCCKSIAADGQDVHCFHKSYNDLLKDEIINSYIP